MPFKPTHGLSRNRENKTKHTRLYGRWANIKNRCHNKKSKDYPKYGGRGIYVCDEWLHDFKAFHDWAISNGYRSELQLDRKDNNGPYSPENCRWSTPKANSNNRRDNISITVNGITDTVMGWSSKTGIPIPTIYKHNKNGTAVDYISRALMRGKRDERSGK